MRTSRGYSNYRGRTSFGRILLSIVLILVILGAGAFLFLQKYLVYSDDGSVRLELPWQREETAPPPSSAGEENVDLVIQESEKPAAAQVAALLLTQDSAAWPAALAGLSAGGQNAVAVPVKARGGAGLSGPAADALPLLLEGETVCIARLSTLRDSGYVQENLDAAGLKNTGGYAFYDGNNECWLDPAKPATAAYLTGLAETYAKLGFDEILLSDLSYPTEGKVSKIDYGGADRTESITALLGKFREVLAAYDIRLTLELPKAVVESGKDDLAGLDTERLYPLVDAVYVTAAETERETLAAKLPEGLALVLQLEAAPQGEGAYLLLG